MLFDYTNTLDLTCHQLGSDHASAVTKVALVQFWLIVACVYGNECTKETCCYINMRELGLNEANGGMRMSCGDAWVAWSILYKCYHLTPGPVLCLLLRVSSDYAQPITGQVTEVTCPVIGRAQPELTPIMLMCACATKHQCHFSLIPGWGLQSWYLPFRYFPRSSKSSKHCNGLGQDGSNSSA